MRRNKMNEEKEWGVLSTTYTQYGWLEGYEWGDEDDEEYEECGECVALKKQIVELEEKRDYYCIEMLKAQDEANSLR